MLNDGHLQKAVLAELRWEPSVPAVHIGVSVNSGVVTLSGHVTSFAEKHAAEDATFRVKGVKGLVQEIKVRLPSGVNPSDEDIALAAADRLRWDVSVPRNAVQVEVEKGWITLSGEVDWHYQKEAAGQDVARLLGAIGMTNNITIKSKVNVGAISDDIMHALHRSWFFDPRTVTVSAQDGKVILTGTVHTHHERQVAAAAAWAAPGVTDVENEIAIV